MAHTFAVQFQPRFWFEGWKVGCCESLGSLGWVLPPPSNSHIGFMEKKMEADRV